jgi:hypothetical protein
MKNCTPHYFKNAISGTYDLKGSTYNRQVSNYKSLVGKDLDFKKW